MSGEWKVKIDSVQHKIMLPGSLAENKVGFQPKDSVTNILTETYSYQGAAWKEQKFPKYLSTEYFWGARTACPLHIYI